MLLSLFTFANDDKPGAKAIVSRNTVVAGNVIDLKIRANGDKVVFPNIETIDGIKILSRQERVTNIHTYNMGKFKKERTTLLLTFAPQKDMTIPPYTVEIDGKLYQTQAIKLHVKDANASEQVFALHLKSNKKSIIQGEAFLVTVSISLRKGAVVSEKLQYSRPEFRGFFVRKAGEMERHEEGDLRVNEYHYILTPHSEGNYTLGPAQAKIGLGDKRKRDILHKGHATKWYNKASNTLAIEVFPTAVTSDLVGRFSIDARLDTRNANAYKPVSLTIKIEGEGNLADFEFPDYLLDGVTVYGEDAKIVSKVLDGEIRSSYSKKFVFVSGSSFTIPERTIRVYDPGTASLKLLKIKAFDVKIKNTNTTASSASSHKPADMEKHKRERKGEISTTERWILALAFALGAVFFYLLRYLPKPKRGVSPESEALAILHGHISEDPEVEAMVRRLYARKRGDKSILIDKKRLKELVARYR